MCLDGIDRTRPERTVAVMRIIVDGAEAYSFEAAEGESVILDPTIESLSGLTKPLIVTPRVLGESTARVQIEPGAADSQVDSNMIRVTLEFVQDSYIEWVNDGVIHNGVYMKAGQRRTLEAVNRLEIDHICQSITGALNTFRVLLRGISPHPHPYSLYMFK